MDLKIVNTGNTTNISTISTTVSTTTPSNITRTVSFKIIWKELDSPGETTDVLTCFSACTNGKFMSMSGAKTRQIGNLKVGALMRCLMYLTLYIIKGIN